MIVEGKNKCKYPVEARPSMESSGIDVFATAHAAGIDTYVIKDQNLLEPDTLPIFTLLLLE